MPSNVIAFNADVSTRPDDISNEIIQWFFSAGEDLKDQFQVTPVNASMSVGIDRQPVDRVIAIPRKKLIHWIKSNFDFQFGCNCLFVVQCFFYNDYICVNCV